MSIDPAVHKLILQFFNKDIPFNQLVGMHLTELSAGHALIEVPFKEELVGDKSRPALHGGVLSALIDSAGGAAAFSKVDVLAGDTLSTLDMRIDYLRPAELRKLYARATVSRMGNRVASVDIVAFHEDQEERLIATGKAVYSVKRGER